MPIVPSKYAFGYDTENAVKHIPRDIRIKRLLVIFREEQHKHMQNNQHFDVPGKRLEVLMHLRGHVCWHSKLTHAELIGAFYKGQ